MSIPIDELVPDEWYLIRILGSADLLDNQRKAGLNYGQLRRALYTEDHSDGVHYFSIDNKYCILLDEVEVLRGL